MRTVQQVPAISRHSTACHSTQNIIKHRETDETRELPHQLKGLITVKQILPRKFIRERECNIKPWEDLGGAEGADSVVAKIASSSSSIMSSVICIGPPLGWGVSVKRISSVKYPMKNTKKMSFGEKTLGEPHMSLASLCPTGFIKKALKIRKVNSTAWASNKNKTFHRQAFSTTNLLSSGLLS